MCSYNVWCTRLVCSLVFKLVRLICFEEKGGIVRLVRGIVVYRSR